MLKLFKKALFVSVLLLLFSAFSFNVKNVSAADILNQLAQNSSSAKTVIDNLENSIKQNEAFKKLVEKNSSLKSFIGSVRDFVDNFDIFIKSLIEIDEKTGLFSNLEGFKTLVRDSIEELKIIVEDLSNEVDPELLLTVLENFKNINQISGAISNISKSFDAGKKALQALDNFQKAFAQIKNDLNLKNIKFRLELTVNGKKKIEDIISASLPNLLDKFNKEISQIITILLRLSACASGFSPDPACQNQQTLIQELKNTLKTTLPKALDELVNYLTQNLKIEVSFEGFSDLLGDIQSTFKIANVKIIQKKQNSEITFSVEGAGSIGSEDKIQWIIKYKGKTYDYDVANPKLNIAQLDLLENLYAQLSSISEIVAQVAIVKSDKSQPLMIASLNDRHPISQSSECKDASDVGKSCDIPGGQLNEGKCVFNQSSITIECIAPSPGDKCENLADVGKKCDNNKGVCVETPGIPGTYFCQIDNRQLTGGSNPATEVSDDCTSKNRGQACTANNGQNGRCDYIPDSNGKNLWCRPVFNSCIGKSIGDECEIDGKKGNCQDYQKPELLCKVFAGAGRSWTVDNPNKPGAPSQVSLDEDCKEGILENGGLVPCRGTAGCPCTFCHIFYLIQKIINFITLKLVPIVAILLIIIGGAMYLFNFGSTERVKQGTDILIGVAVGILIVYGAWIIINTILVAFVPESGALKDFPSKWFSITCPIK